MPKEFTHPYYVGEGKVPTQEDVSEAYTNLMGKLIFDAPQIIRDFKRRKQEERGNEMKLRHKSNELPLGVPDRLGQIHASSGSKERRGSLHKILAAEARHECPSRGGWGRYRNLTREEFGEQVNVFLRKKRLDDLNQAFTDAEISDRRRK